MRRLFLLLGVLCVTSAYAVAIKLPSLSGDTATTTKPAAKQTTPAKPATPSVINNDQATQTTAFNLHPNNLPAADKQFDQATKKHLQKLDSEIDSLQQQQQQISTTIAGLQSSLQSLQQQVSQIPAIPQEFKAPKNTVRPWLATWVNLFGPVGAVIVAAIILLVVLVGAVWILSHRRRRDDVEDDEFDYMNSEEGVSAKLDLARTYIDMGDNLQAKKVLNEVLSDGDEDQRAMAKQLLSKLNR